MPGCQPQPVPRTPPGTTDGRCCRGSLCGMRERSGSHQRRRVRARDPPAAGAAFRNSPRPPLREQLHAAGPPQTGGGAAGGAQTHTPGRAAGDAQRTPPFSTKLAQFAICRKAPLRGGDRDRAHGSRKGKRLIRLPGAHRLTHPQSLARMSTERTEKTSYTRRYLLCR